MATWSSRSTGRAPSDWTCRYRDLVGAPGGFEIAIDHTSTPVLEEGRQYALVCTDETGLVVYQLAITWDPADPLSGLVAEERLAEQALADLILPEPAVAASPPLTSPHLVGLATWLWIEDWAPVSATASLGGTAATVTADPTAVNWDMGDGTVHVCPGPGTAYGTTDRTDCAHVWRDRSTATAAGTFPVTATVDWHVTWTATNGATGDLGTLTSATTAAVTVVEAQAVIND